MSIAARSLGQSVINPRRIFAYAILVELIALGVLATEDPVIIGGFAAILSLPVVLLLIPKEPLIGLPLMFIATGFDQFAQITEAGDSFNLTYFHLAMAITFLSVFVNHLLRNQTNIPATSLWPSLLAFLAMMAISLLYSPMFMAGFLELVRLSVLLLLTFSMIVSIDTEKRAKLVVWSYIIIPALVAMYTIYEIMTQGSFFASQVIRVATELGIPVYRSTGTFRNPNVLACFLMTGVTVGFGLLLVKSTNWLMKLFLVILVAITSIGVIASFSRAGWLSTAVAVFLIILIHRQWRYFYIFAAIMAVVLIILSIKFPHILLSTLERFVSIFNPMAEDSSSSRISLMKTGIWMWQDHPLFGVGASSHAYYAPFYTDPNMPSILLWVVEPHTIQTKILAEEGLIGFSLAAWFFFTVIYDSLRSLKTMASDYLKHIQVAFIALFIGFIVNFTFGADLLNNSFWISVGVLYAIPIADANEKARKKKSISSESNSSVVPSTT